jgi:hypothetical protein
MLPASCNRTLSRSNGARNGQQWAAAAARTPPGRRLGLAANTENPLYNAYIETRGAIAQLGERLLCKQEVAGSIPAGSIGV